MENTYKLNVQGMHCQSCEILVTEELKELLGVTAVQISAKDGQGILKTTSNSVTVSDIVQAIKRAGYESTVTEDHSMHQASNQGFLKEEAVQLPAPAVLMPVRESGENRKISLSLSGMHCSSCAG
ncbi:MAG: heavy-metal-associated domain-containing protein, partial [Patescibacteria group bacterium]